MVKDAKILILGITFKENCPDIRNTKVVDIYTTLHEYTDNITVFDPHANVEAVKHEYGVTVVNMLPQIVMTLLSSLLLTMSFWRWI